MNCTEFLELDIYYLKYTKSALNMHVENIKGMLSIQVCMNWTVNLRSLHENTLLKF
jgi:hypothetical protein